MKSLRDVMSEAVTKVITEETEDRIRVGSDGDFECDDGNCTIGHDRLIDAIMAVIRENAA